MIDTKGIATAVDPTRATLAELVGLHGGVGARARRRPTRASTTGPARSPFRGRGMDYAESRAYSAGDDVRHVDWRLTARSGELHTKLFEVERDRVSLVIVDTGAAMAFATRGVYKRVQAARIGAAWAWAVRDQGERIAAATFGASARIGRAAAGRRGVLRALGALVAAQSVDAVADLAAPLGRQLDRLRALHPSGAQALILMDPRSMTASDAAGLTRFAAHNELLVGFIVDPLEVEPLPPGSYALRQGHEEGRIEIDDAAAGQRLLSQLAAPRLQAEAILKGAGIASVALRTDLEAHQALKMLSDAVPRGRAGRRPSGSKKAA